MACLHNNAVLKGRGITTLVGDEKNKNKNPVAERAVQEVEQEILRIQPEKGPVTNVTLALATAATNSRIRRDGLSSRELWTQRDQLTGAQFPFKDEDVIDHQSRARHKNHDVSAKCKARGRGPNDPSGIKVGSLVYLVAEVSKLQARDKYMITSVTGNSCTIRKFTRTQFRKRQYTVPIKSVFPIVGKESLSDQYRSDSDSSSSDSEEEGRVDDEIDDEVPEDADENEGEEDVAVDVVADGNNARPRRNVKAPGWHDDYEMGSFE